MLAMWYHGILVMIYDVQLVWPKNLEKSRRSAEIRKTIFFFFFLHNNYYLPQKCGPSQIIVWFLNDKSWASAC